MSLNILVVGAARQFCSGLGELLASHGEGVLLHSVDNRREALPVLEERRFTQLITALRIPGVSDGYRLLSQVAGKVLDGRKIITLVDCNNDKVRGDIGRFGVENVYTQADLEAIKSLILGHAGMARKSAVVAKSGALGVATVPETSRAYPLSLADEGELVRVWLLPKEGRTAAELQRLGLAIGDQLLIVQKQPGGAVKIQKNGSSYALGVGLAHKIAVVRG